MPLVGIGYGKIIMTVGSIAFRNYFYVSNFHLLVLRCLAVRRTLNFKNAGFNQA